MKNNLWKRSNFISLLLSVFFNLLVFLGSKLKIDSGSISAGSYRSVNPLLKGYQKGKLVMNFLDVETRFLPKTQGSILSFKLHLTIFPKKTSSIEKSMIEFHLPESCQSEKFQIPLLLLKYFDNQTLLSVTSGLVSAVKVSIESFIPLSNYLTGKVLICFT